MSPVTLVGMIMGSLVVLTSCLIFGSKKEFPAGGLAAMLVGVVLISISQWTHIKLNAGGSSLELDAVKKELASTTAQLQQTTAETKANAQATRETAAATDAVAEQAERAAGASEVTRRTVVALASQLEVNKALSPAAAAPIKTTLDTVTHASVPAISSARKRLQVLKARP